MATHNASDFKDPACTPGSKDGAIVDFVIALCLVSTQDITGYVLILSLYPDNILSSFHVLSQLSQLYY